MNLSELAGKRITLVRNLKSPNSEGHLAVEVEGLVEVVAPDNSALVIKPRGSTMNFMLEASDIEPGTIIVHVDKPRELATKKLAPLTLANARQHLLDRHCWMLELVNITSDQAALDLHARIDHALMGHYHNDIDSLMGPRRHEELD